MKLSELSHSIKKENIYLKLEHCTFDMLLQNKCIDKIFTKYFNIVEVINFNDGLVEYLLMNHLKKKYFNEKYKKISKKKKINYFSFSFSFSMKIFPKLTLLEYLLTIPFNDK